MLVLSTAVLLDVINTVKNFVELGEESRDPLHHSRSSDSVENNDNNSNNNNNNNNDFTDNSAKLKIKLFKDAQAANLEV